MELLDAIAKTSLKESDLIKLIFMGYEKRRKIGNLYSKDDYIPQNLIRLYFKSDGCLDFSKIVYNFKRKYIYNENEIENVHNKEERDGLSAVYDYIQTGDNDKCPNIYVILVLHSLLYSKMPYPEFGGKFRNVCACISNSDVRTTEPENITREIANLYSTYTDILKLSELVKETNSMELLMNYIDRAVELKCRLIEIHPFIDGNGRTCRALLNLLFRKVNLPPVYVKKTEKKEYIEAMDRAIRLKDTTSIKKFYYYKICDSIVELDISERIKKDEKENMKIKSLF